MAATAPTRASGKRRAALDHGTAMRLAATEYGRFLAELKELPDAAWTLPTACPAWDIHAMACHVLGMTKMSTSIRENMRQVKAATAESKASGGLFIDALTELQVREHAHLSAAAVVAELETAAPAAARGRKRTPAPMRRFVSVGEQPIDDNGEATEPWSLGYLNDVILTRDTWMHRSDIAAAAGVEMALTQEHDGRLIADVASEWASRHGQPCTLRLTGPAGGTWTWGTGGPTLECDAVEFCRVLSGRGADEGLLAARVPF